MPPMWFCVVYKCLKITFIAHRNPFQLEWTFAYQEQSQWTIVESGQN